MTTSHSIQRFSLAACAAAILVFGTGCSSTTDLLVKMRLINAKPYENTQEARDTHRDNCMANYGLENKHQVMAASSEIQSAYLYCLRNTDGWYLVEENQYWSELARIHRDYYARNESQTSTL